MAIEIRNPHSVLAALATRPHDVMEIRTSAQRPGDAWNRVFEEAARTGIPVSGMRPSGGARRRRKEAGAGRQSSSVAVVRERRSIALEDLLQSVEAEQPRLWLALDCLQDPHNVGAVFRSAAFYGIAGIVLTRDRSAPLNSTVYDIATGGLEYVPFTQVANLSQALRTARDRGLWILGSSEHASNDISAVDTDRPWMLVIGNEERGLRRLTIERCDEMCAIHPRGQVKSLNVSVAAGSMMAVLASRGLSGQTGS